MGPGILLDSRSMDSDAAKTGKSKQSKEIKTIRTNAEKRTYSTPCWFAAQIIHFLYSIMQKNSIVILKL